MAKELFKNIKTGEQEFLFCWESPYDNEKLKNFLQNNSIIDIEINKIKLDYGSVLNIKPNDYFRKTLDNRIEFFTPKDMIKKFAYIGDAIAEEFISDEDFKKRIYEKRPNISDDEFTHIQQIWADFKYKIENDKSEFDNTKDGLYNSILFHSKFENFICELENEYNSNVTESFWEEFEKRTPFKKGCDKYDIAAVLSDFPFEKYLKSEDKQKEFVFSVFEFSDKAEKWYKEQDKEPTENYMSTLYSDENGQIIFSIQRYSDGRILELEFVTDRAEYNPFY